MIFPIINQINAAFVVKTLINFFGGNGMLGIELYIDS